MKGYVSRIQRFSLDDGPGIRATVFLRGCNLACKWCHNPECIPNRQVVLFNVDACIGCRKCADVCPGSAHSFVCGHTLDRAQCTGCGDCASVCVTGALKMNAQILESRDLFEMLLADRRFYRQSQGGVTFSGGEPVLQFEYLLELVQALKSEGIHVAIDTAGNYSYSKLEKLIPYTDLFLFDVKAVDPDLHRRITGVGNETILKNLQRLSDSGARIWTRTPYIPQYQSADEIMRIAEMIGRLNVERAELLPYHKLGIYKYRELGLDYEVTCNEPDISEMRAVFQASCASRKDHERP